MSSFKEIGNVLLEKRLFVTNLQGIAEMLVEISY